MGIVGAFLGWGLSFVMFKGFRKVMSDEKTSVLLATSVAAFITTLVTAFILGLELLAIPGLTFEFVYIITGIHLFIAVGEAILTFVILLYSRIMLSFASPVQNCAA